MVINVDANQSVNLNQGAVPGFMHVYCVGPAAANFGITIVNPPPPYTYHNLVAGHMLTFQVDGLPVWVQNQGPSRIQLLSAQAEFEVQPVERVVGASSVPSSPAHQASLQQPLMSSSAEQAMATLTAQWYNTLVGACGLDQSSFQLFQSNQPVGTDSSSLWNIFDTVPPLSVNNFFNPSQWNVFSSDYGAVINNLQPQNSSTFLKAIGDYYPLWVAYLKTSPQLPTVTPPQLAIVQLFYNWSQMNMPPAQAQAAYTAYQQIAQGVVPVAVQMWLNAGGGTGGVKAYNNTYEALQSALLSAPPKSFTMNSTTASSDITHTWANGQTEGIFDFFFGSASASWDELTVKLADAGVNISVNFTHLTNFTAAPLAFPSTDPILSQYKPWYNSGVLNLAYHHNDNTVWQQTPPTWADTFGPTGNMLRMATNLVIVDGITITTTSEVGLSTSDQASFQAAAEGGFFPFFIASGSGGWNHDVTFDDQGNLTVSSTCPAGNPNIIGVNVSPIGTILTVSS